MAHQVIQTENLPDQCSTWLADQCELHVCSAESLRFEELLPTVEGLVIRTYTEVTRAMIESAPNLRVVGRAGVGIDNIDLKACKEYGIRVVHTPEANTESVVEFVLSRMLMMLRKVTLVEGESSQKEWELLRVSAMNEKQFSEMTLGIVGFGRIGSRLGQLASTLGFNVIFHDIKTIQNTGSCKQCTLEELLQTSDAVTIHVDGRLENEHMCGADFFRGLKQGCLFINTSRGFVVDAHALANHLCHDATAFGIIDVHQPEPVHTEYPLLNLPNSELYPHIASKTQTATINMGWVVKDVIAVLDNETPKFEALLR